MLLLLLSVASSGRAQPASERPTIEGLRNRPFLDDYLSNVLYGWQLVTETETYGARYTGNSLRCTNCHLKAGTVRDALPLNVAGMYPKWRGKNHKRNGIGLRIRECFVYSLNGIMPPENAPEVLAIAAYISWLSEGEVIGRAPPGRGVPTLPDTGFDPNPSNGRVVYKQKCAACHDQTRLGGLRIPPLWGFDSYNEGAGMHRIPKAAGFIWANMPLNAGRTLTHQQAFDVAAYLHTQIRPADPRKGRLRKILELVTRLPVFGGADP